MGLEASYGTGSDTDGLVPSRSLETGAILLDLGWHLDLLTPFFRGEYFNSGQTTDPSKVSNQNLSSTGYLTSVGLRLDLRRYFVEFGYDFYGSRTISVSTSTGQREVYSATQGGYGALGHEFGSDFAVFIFYRQLTYAHSYDGIYNSDISANKLRFFDYGLGLLFYLH